MQKAKINLLEDGLCQLFVFFLLHVASLRWGWRSLNDVEGFLPDREGLMKDILCLHYGECMLQYYLSFIHIAN